MIWFVGQRYSVDLNSRESKEMVGKSSYIPVVLVF